jgi:hypothetical protein
MAVSLRMTPISRTPVSQAPAQAPEPQKPTLPAALQVPAHAYLARLAALHDEAAETAYLANLLGRAPWAAGLLGAAALMTVLTSAQSASPVAVSVWVALVAIAVAAIGRTYGKAIEVPFDRETLKDFARSLSAILLFAGAAWGAGIFLALANVGPVAALAFTATVSALLAAILRARDVAFCFLVPATAMGAFCALMRDGGFAAMLALLAGGLLVAGAAILFERVTIPASRTQHG